MLFKDMDTNRDFRDFKTNVDPDRFTTCEEASVILKETYELQVYCMCVSIESPAMVV